MRAGNGSLFASKSFERQLDLFSQAHRGQCSQASKPSSRSRDCRREEPTRLPARPGAQCGCLYRRVGPDPGGGDARGAPASRTRGALECFEARRRRRPSNPCWRHRSRRRARQPYHGRSRAAGARPWSLEPGVWSPCSAWRLSQK